MESNNAINKQNFHCHHTCYAQRKKAICMRREMTFDVSRLLSVNNRLELIVNECLPSSMINNLGTLCLLVAGGV